MSNIFAKRPELSKPMEPCWKREGVIRSLSTVANLAQSETHYFLASHAPFQRIHDDRTHEDLSDAELFDALFLSSLRNVQAIIHGEPGSGKSHLIHWLKLRCEEEVAGDGPLKDIRCVLIERRNGSLKDALQQIVDQLGDQFASYLESIRGALRQISSDTARQELAGQFKLELGPRRRDRDLPFLPADLKYFPECFVAPAFGEWLCREGGTIATVVSRLNESSTVDDRQRLPEFEVADFQPPPQYYRNNPPVVCELIEQFLDSYELCEQACALANEAFRDAVGGMTGISGADLQNVFFDIRRDLARQNRRLALFVEDVSVMSALDKELVIALEPQEREGLCDLFAVLGITDSGLESIRNMAKNQLQRVTYFFSVGQSQTRWGEDKDGVATFVARYLNTVRLPEDKVRQIAEYRRNGGDVHLSACDPCPLGVAAECHDRFGYVQLNSETRVGMFPFTRDVPHRWLHLFGDSGPPDFGKTPRALLMLLLHPALNQPERVPHQFPPSLTLPPLALAYWTSFEEQYCGGWPSDEKRRLQRLAAAWVNVRNAHEAASELEPFRAAFGFRQFTREIVSDLPPPADIPPKPEQGSKEPEAIPVALTRILAAIDHWQSGGELLEDGEPRRLLFQLVRNSVSWKDVTIVPAKERQRLIEDKGLIDIEGQRSKAKGATIQFARNEETANLIRALAHFHLVGKDSWNFTDGERFKRLVASWLRRNGDKVVTALEPRGVEPSEAVAAAVQFLSVAFVLGHKKKLPVDDLPSLTEALFEDFPTEPPRRFSKEGEAIVLAIQRQHSEVRRMLAHELSVPQGEATSCNFINPLGLARLAREAAIQLTIRSVGSDFHSGFWRQRYLPLASLPSLERLWDREREELGYLCNAITTKLQEAGDIEQSLREYCGELSVIRELLKQFPVPHLDFDQLWRRQVYTQRIDNWCGELRRAQELLKDPSPSAIATYSPDTLVELDNALRVSEDFLDEVVRHVRPVIEAVTAEGDPNELSARLKNILSELVELGEQNNQ